MSTTPTTPMPIAMSRLITGSFGERARLLHDVGVALLQPERERRRAVAHEVEPQELHRPQRHRHARTASRRTRSGSRPTLQASRK